MLQVFNPGINPQNLVLIADEVVIPFQKSSISYQSYDCILYTLYGYYILKILISNYFKSQYF